MTNVWYVKNMLANCDGNLHLPILHLPRVELHCKLQEKLHRVTGPLCAGVLLYSVTPTKHSFDSPGVTCLVFLEFQR